MDFIAFDESDLTTPDRAERARKAWELYRSEHGGGVQDLISDLLHLADVDEHPGGASYAGRRGVASYVAEVPTWPTGQPECTGAYLAQTRPAGRGWINVAGGDDPRAVAEELWHAMQVVGFRICDLAGHVDDLAEGHVLTSEDGHDFRVIKRAGADSTN
ncbi:hypothetical protein ABZW18_26170 [Streptomyces sp. NPDC004647]|uniref:hypothetical protein n=1 Tax=Streptomyces sp. NPDC004647 TaxID=3154671 RepID=UPI0033BE2635